MHPKNRTKSIAGKQKLLLTGSTGIIGKCLCRYLSDKFDLLVTYHNSGVPKNVRSARLDITDKDQVFKVVEDFNPDVVIHLVGKKLKFCETDPEGAYAINYNGTKNLVDACAPGKAKFIFVSSDYVFDGARGGYKESDATNSTTVHGKTKALAEEYIIKQSSDYAIFRTSAVYCKGATFYDMVVKHLAANTPVEAFVDTYFTPTYFGDLAWALSSVAHKSKTNGIYHVAGTSVVSRYEMAFMMAVYLKADLRLIRPQYVGETDELIRKNTSLNCDHTMRLFKRRFLSLKEGLSLLLVKGREY